MPQTATGLLGAQQTPGVLTPAMLAPFTKGSSLRVGLLSYWTLDELSGSSAADAVGGRTGTWAGTLGSQWTTGFLHGGGLFNGTNNQITTAISLGALDGFTLTCWCFLTDATGQRVAVGGSQGTNNFYISVATSATTVFCRTSGTGNNDVSGPYPGLSQWVHVAFTRAPSFERIVYVNGARVARDTNGTVVNFGTFNTLSIGSRGGSLFWAGTVDEVGIWSRPLADAEVSALYNAGAGRRPF
jgi:hypothetical protein